MMVASCHKNIVHAVAALDPACTYTYLVILLCLRWISIYIYTAISSRPADSNFMKNAYTTWFNSTSIIFSPV
jgi:NhaP-type Na+/H+ or K+/H+ antiporter